MDSVSREGFAEAVASQVRQKDLIQFYSGRVLWWLLIVVVDFGVVSTRELRSLFGEKVSCIAVCIYQSICQDKSCVLTN